MLGTLLAELRSTPAFIDAFTARDLFGQYGFQVEIRDAATGATPQNYMMRQGCGGMVGVPRGAGRG